MPAVRWWPITLSWPGNPIPIASVPALDWESAAVATRARFPLTPERLLRVDGVPLDILPMTLTANQARAIRRATGRSTGRDTGRGISRAIGRLPASSNAKRAQAMAEYWRRKKSGR